jgi:CheY-like chemotaxis protein
MSKKVLLVGHCGPDSSYLRMAIRSAAPHVQVLAADEASELERVLHHDQIDLVLLNRELGYGFDEPLGAAVIRSLRSKHPELKMMLVSNYADAQAAAVEAGALPGFGKREIGTPRVAKLLKEALGEHAKSATS